MRGILTLITDLLISFNPIINYQPESHLIIWLYDYGVHYVVFLQCIPLNMELDLMLNTMLSLSLHNLS